MIAVLQESNVVRVGVPIYPDWFKTIQGVEYDFDEDGSVLRMTIPNGNQTIIAEKGDMLVNVDGNVVQIPKSASVFMR